jgi:hypothetical protein
MIDDDRDDLNDRDPAKLLPFVRELMPHDPNVEELPRRQFNWHAEESRHVAETDAAEASRDLATD